MSTISSILVGLANKIVWVRVEGKGSFLNSGGVKDFTKEMINRGHREFIFDLKNWPGHGLDFHGTLAGVALRLRELGQGHLHVINLNERNQDLLSNLGLDQLFTMGIDGLKMNEAPIRPLDTARRAGRPDHASGDDARSAPGARGRIARKHHEIQGRAGVSQAGPAPV